MGNEIFGTLIKRKIDIFSNTFAHDSNSIFKNNQSKLIHPAEYGSYREKTFKELLKFVVNKDTSVSDGFVITSVNNGRSTQCDVIIYQNNVIPLIDNNIAKFFPIEIVNGIGEIKSDLEKKQFIDALKKLAENKKLMDERKGEGTINNPVFEEYNQIMSFLVCNKLKFDVDSINFKEVYGDIPRKYWHNFILSLEDGVFIYKMYFDQFQGKVKESFDSANGNTKAESRIWPYSLRIVKGDIYKCPEYFIEISEKEEEKYSHVIHFLTSISAVLNEQSHYKFDFVEYLDLGGKDPLFDY